MQRLSNLRPGHAYAAGFIALLVIALFARGLHYPLVYSDLHWFAPENLATLANPDFSLRYLSKRIAHALHRAGHGQVAILHAWIIALHALVAVAVYAFFRRLLGAAAVGTAETFTAQRATLVATTAALLVALHPLQVYAVAFVGEQEYVLATLFGLLCLHSWLEGLLRRNQPLLFAAVACYALSLLSKESLIATPALLGVLTLLFTPITVHTLRRVALPALLIAAIAALVFIKLAAISQPVTASGHATSQLAAFASGSAIAPLSWARSALSQAGLFFAYGALWLAPDPAGMAIDIQRKLLTGEIPASAWIALAAFLAWPLACLALLPGRGLRGLIGFGLLWPWLLFLPEFATIRAQEAFVLYRCYAWIIGPSFVLAIVIFRLPSRIAPAVAIPLLAGLFLLAQSRLATFADEERLWADAIRTNRPDETATLSPQRAYTNRGNIRLARGRNQDALEDFTQAARLAPHAPETQLNIAVALVGLGQPEQALLAAIAAIDLAAQPRPAIRARALANRAAILYALDRPREALADLDEAARLDPARAEYRDNAEKLRVVIGD